MKESTRKIFSKIGAGLMLGLSLFNLGAAYLKEAGGDFPKRIRQIRRREKEQLRPESKMITEIAEQEGRAVIAQQQTREETDVVLAQGRLTLPQIVIRFMAATVWGVTASIFFTSMVFNVPFTLGKAVLSLLPGVPHTTLMQLSSANKFFEQGKPVGLALSLDTHKDKVDYIKAAVVFDQQLLNLDSFHMTSSLFSSVERVDTGSGQVEFILQAAKPVALSNEKILEINFISPKKEVVSAVQIDKEASAVLMSENGTRHNVLGAVQGFTFRIIPGAEKEVVCRRLEDDVIKDAQDWKNVATGSPADNQNNWAEVDIVRGIRCHYDDNKIYIIYSGIPVDEPEFFATSPSKVKSRPNEKLFQWEEGKRKFTVLADNPSSTNTGDKMDFRLEYGNRGENKWPEEGRAYLIFQ